MSSARSSSWQRSERYPDDHGGPMVNVRDERPASPPALPAPRISLRALRLSVGSSRFRGLLLSTASLAIAFLIWQFLSTFVFNPFLIPPPVEVIRAAIPMLLSGEIFADVAISMMRVSVGCAAGSLFGVVLGVLLGRIKTLHELLDPIIELLRYL